MSQMFVADVGGTNIRLALVENGSLMHITKYLCKQFDTITDAITHFAREANVDNFEYGCIAIACPVNDDLVKMTNHTWAFSKTALKKELNLARLLVINDFSAVAYSLPTLTKEQVIQVGSGVPLEKGNIAVFGPGTGLGVEHLTWTSGGWQTLDGEGGHVDFAPNDENDLIVWRYIKAKLGRVPAEELLSGRGLVNIYQALARHDGIETVFDDPADITKHALANTDPTCVNAVQLFCRVMGSFAGNLALNLCTTGGVFIGGGIASRLGEFFVNSDFRSKFEDKGNFAGYVKNIPTYLINEPDHGLLGALAYLLQQTKEKH
ncbi:glucokinase [Brumicola nitratireducens]|uniref:Glucokinase n=1 Tax=Glaciecola nitratireducens (strain JCM 12485 / KCTC 12276 / FR1064) TaxID=1085623 RepID=G4QH28_GLANF|nr:glucokinase [Glaciecola nitratireducens]AEP30216.1 glucokinase [Glaciecola nitratireducens FR1064]